jgi:hypothetical protein
MLLRSLYFSLIALTLLPLRAVSQVAFHQGSLLLSVSEGVTGSRFQTVNGQAVANDGQSTANIIGERDPLTVEYGISPRWGLGLNMGADVWKVSPAMYGIVSDGGNIKAYTSELTLDANYHFWVTKRADFAAFLSVGFAGVNIDETRGDQQLKYRANGGITRAGFKARYYCFKRLGIMGMVSGFNTTCSSTGVKDNTVGRDYSTSVKGWAIEFGPCFRFF